MMKLCKNPKCDIKEKQSLGKFSKDKNKKDGLQRWCKKCVSKYSKQHYEDNKEKRLEQNRQWFQNNKEKKLKQNKQWYLNNKGKIDEYQKQWYKNNKEKVLEQQEQRYKGNKEEINTKAKQYREDNKEKESVRHRRYYLDNKEKRNEYRRNKRQNDIQFKLANNLRGRLNLAIKNKYKAGSAVRDLGCSTEEFKQYIEFKFQPGMTWENYGIYGWHLDHIQALANFDLIDRQQFLEACHFSNLQPMWAKENLLKSNKIQNAPKE